jgi:hypothetical protein
MPVGVRLDAEALHQGLELRYGGQGFRPARRFNA